MLDSTVTSFSDASIELSTIDDHDVTYLNGAEIGRTNQWNAVRKYSIPAGILKKGENVIAIRITDTGGSGGIYGDPTALKLTYGSITIPLSGVWKFQVESIHTVLNKNSFPSLAFNAMIHPLIPFPFAGVLWYQGEANTARAYQYRKTFPLLIQDWRKQWNNSNLPFYFVQLASFCTPGDSNSGCEWAELRESQALTAHVIPNTAMCVTTDIGDALDIHPKNKQEVGSRLARLALHYTYKKDIECEGPSFKSLRIKGNEAIVTFENTAGGLYTTDMLGRVMGFEIAGADQVFYEARGVIRDNTVVLFSDKVPNPVAVNFGWRGDAGSNNLFNKEGLPALPFRTHEWKTVTQHNTYKITLPVVRN
jgi:sialate O-acetylesterase